MRFRKGDKVEVMNRKEAAISWHSAVILSGDGITCRVRYDFYCGLPDGQLVETVTFKLVRPCPPLVRGAEHYVAGDVVEVFHESSWKICAILKILGGKKGNISNMICFQDVSFQNQYLVRLFGSSKELIVERSVIRMRQVWHDDRWILMEKYCSGGEDILASINFGVPKGDGKAKSQRQKDRRNNPNNTSFSELPMISSRPRKRKPLYHSPIVALEKVDAVAYPREIQKDGKELGLFASSGLEKVDAVAYPREFLGEESMHTSFNITSNGYNRMERSKQKDVLDFSQVRSSGLNCSDSDACSVGSCSVTDICPNNCYNHLYPHCCQDTDTGSDAESIWSGSKRKRCSLPPKEEIEVNIRKLELHAYRCTLEVLYASGPLSWEQETLLTNLRIMLHISNDEHLKELKHLISEKTAVFV